MLIPHTFAFKHGYLFKHIFLFFFFFFSIANILPIAPGKYNIPVNVLKSISKQILIKALRTEA